MPGIEIGEVEILESGPVRERFELIVIANKNEVSHFNFDKKKFGKLVVIKELDADHNNLILINIQVIFYLYFFKVYFFVFFV